MSNLSAAFSQLGKASPLYSMLIKMAQQISNRNNANEVYKNLMPLLDDMLAKGYAFESKEIQSIVVLLRELPKDPNAFNGQGCWH